MKHPSPAHGSGDPRRTPHPLRAHRVRSLRLSVFALSAATLAVAANTTPTASACTPSEKTLDSLLAASAVPAAWRCVEGLETDSVRQKVQEKVQEDVQEKAREEAALRLRSALARSGDTRWQHWMIQARDSETWAASLATALFPDPQRSQQLGDAFSAAGHHLPAALAYLAMADADEARLRYASFRAEEALRRAETTLEKEEALDSLMNLAATRLSAGGLAALESLLWTQRQPRQAWKIFLTRDRKKKTDPEEKVMAARQAFTQGWGTQARGFLEQRSWQNFPKAWKDEAFRLLWGDASDRGDARALTRLSQSLPAGVDSPSRRLRLTEAWLELGRAEEGAAWLAKVPEETGSGSADRHHRIVLQARLFGHAGRWTAADRLLSDWKASPERREGTGALLYWQGWSAWHQGLGRQADSLWFSASGYTGETESTLALQRRLALRRDSSACPALFAGLADAPLSAEKRLAALAKIPAGSALKPDGLWEEARVYARQGLPDSALPALRKLVQEHAATPRGKDAALFLAKMQESQGEAGRRSALVAYERLLLESPQGMPSEWARNRLRALDPTLP